jgi:hypothetical protein
MADRGGGASSMGDDWWRNRQEILEKAERAKNTPNLSPTPTPWNVTPTPSGSSSTSPTPTWYTTPIPPGLTSTPQPPSTQTATATTTATGYPNLPTKHPINIPATANAACKYVSWNTCTGAVGDILDSYGLAPSTNIGNIPPNLPDTGIPQVDWGLKIAGTIYQIIQIFTDPNLNKSQIPYVPLTPYPTGTPPQW